jgi:hypothetical protein
MEFREQDMADKNDEHVLKSMFAAKVAKLAAQAHAMLTGQVIRDNRRISAYGPGVQWAIDRTPAVQDTCRNLEAAECEQFPARFFPDSPPTQHLSIVNEPLPSGMW